jgi:hypothetical protein
LNSVPGSAARFVVLVIVLYEGSDGSASGVMGTGVEQVEKAWCEPVLSAAGADEDRKDAPKGGGIEVRPLKGLGAAAYAGARGAGAGAGVGWNEVPKVLLLSNGVGVGKAVCQ